MQAQSDKRKMGFHRSLCSSSVVRRVGGKYSDINHFQNELMISPLSAVTVETEFSDPLNVNSAVNAIIKALMEQFCAHASKNFFHSNKSD